MAAKMEIEELLNALGHHYGVPELSLDKNDVCQLVFNEGCEIFIEPDALKQSTHLYAVLGGIPNHRKEVFYEAIFEKNLFGKETGESCLHCDVLNNEVLLHQLFRHTVMDKVSFITLVETFVHRVIEQQLWMEGLFFEGGGNSDSQVYSDSPIQVDELGAFNDISISDTERNFLRV
ncbi:type III secretion system chaperone [Hahella ganghwensis]|uniref:type III secretion system chaperone n=1 Tax=Hahella ganghwensis TaxID=286420 RepID=UPI0012F8239C|nr:type III secretion system chaperone [Hahella ganghwensis]